MCYSCSFVVVVNSPCRSFAEIKRRTIRRTKSSIAIIIIICISCSCRQRSSINRCRRRRLARLQMQGRTSTFSDRPHGRGQGGLRGLSPPRASLAPSPNTTNLAPPNFRDMNINVSIKQAKVSNLAPPPDLQILQSFQLQGVALPPDPNLGLCPLDLHWVLCPRPQYRLALPRSR